MNLRWADPDDDEALAQVMFDAVRNGRSHYSEQQRRAWVGAPRSGEAWRARLTQSYVVLAEIDGEARGFMSVDAKGYVDFAYIRPAHQGSGLFRQLFKAVEAKAGEIGLARLWTHASLMAQPAFAVVGFEIVRKEEVELGGELFERYEMEKAL